MNAGDFYATFQRPAAMWCETLPGWMTTIRPSFPPEAHVMMLAIAGVESGWRNIPQVQGPASGPYQFESIGIAGVLDHDPPNGPVHRMAVEACKACRVLPEPSAIYHQFLALPQLQVAFARLLLWSDRHRLPTLGDSIGGFQLYTRTWRPGISSLSRWTECYMQALAVGWWR